MPPECCQTDTSRLFHGILGLQQNEVTSAEAVSWTAGAGAAGAAGPCCTTSKSLWLSCRQSMGLERSAKICSDSRQRSEAKVPSRSPKNLRWERYAHDHAGHNMAIAALQGLFIRQNNPPSTNTWICPACCHVCQALKCHQAGDVTQTGAGSDLYFLQGPASQPLLLSSRNPCTILKAVLKFRKACFACV